MNEDQILKMAPGRELNMLVAKHVMEHEVVVDEIMGNTERFIDEEGNSVWDTLKDYSENMEAASAVVEMMKSKGYADAAGWTEYGSGKYNPSEAICKRALVEIAAQKGQL